MPTNTIRLSLSAIILLLVIFVCVAGLAGFAGSKFFNTTIPVQSNNAGAIIPVAQEITVSPGTLAEDIVKAQGKSIFLLATRSGGSISAQGTGVALTNDGIIMSLNEYKDQSVAGIGEDGNVFPITPIGRDELSGIYFYKSTNKIITPITLSQKTLNVGSSLLALYRQEDTAHITAHPVTFSANLLPEKSAAPGIQKIAYSVDAQRIPKGAALLDENGNLAGVLMDTEKNTSMLVSDIRSALERLSSNQLAHNPYTPLGFTLQYAAKVQENNTMQIKSVVGSITKKSPADVAGLQEDDVLTAISGNAISWDTNIVNALNAKPLVLTIMRKGKEQNITINL